MPKKDVTLTAIEQVVDDKLQSVRDEMTEKFDKVLEGLDGLMKEVVTIRQEQTVMNFAIVEHSKENDTIKKQVKKMERHLGIQ